MLDSCIDSTKIRDYAFNYSVMASGGDKGEDKKGGKRKGLKDLKESPELDSPPLTDIDSTLAPMRVNLTPEEDQSNGEQNQGQNLGAIPKVPRVNLPEEGESKGRSKTADPKSLKLDLSKEGKSKGRNRGQSLEVVPTIRTSRSWAQGSTSKCTCFGEQTRLSPPVTRSQSKSPGRRLMDFAMSLKPKSSSISPRKTFRGSKTWEERQSSETDPLLDYPDGEEKEVPTTKKKKVKDPQPTKIKFTQKEMVLSERYVSDEEKSQTSTLSSQSSGGVSKATGKLNIDDSSESEELEDDGEGKGSQESTSAHGVKERRPSKESRKKKKPLKETKKGKDKSKK